MLLTENIRDERLLSIDVAMDVVKHDLIERAEESMFVVYSQLSMLLISFRIPIAKVIRVHYCGN